LLPCGMNRAAPRQTFCDRVVRVYARPQPDASHGRPDNFNPHCHAIISGGVWTAEGEFLELPRSIRPRFANCFGVFSSAACITGTSVGTFHQKLHASPSGAPDVIRICWGD